MSIGRSARSLFLKGFFKLGPGLKRIESLMTLTGALCEREAWRLLDR